VRWAFVLLKRRRVCMSVKYSQLTQLRSHNVQKRAQVAIEDRRREKKKKKIDTMGRHEKDKEEGKNTKNKEILLITQNADVLKTLVRCVFFGFSLCSRSTCTE
jgi:hypothetical protein